MDRALRQTAQQHTQYPDADAHAFAVIDAALALVDAAAEQLTEKTEAQRWPLSDARSALIGAAGLLDGARDEERRLRQRAAELHVSQDASGRLYITDAAGCPVTDRRHFDTRAALAECDDIRAAREQGIDLSALARARAVLRAYAGHATTPENLDFATLMERIAADLNHAAQHRGAL